MPTQTTKINKKPAYTENGTDAQTDERGRRRVQETPKDQRATKKEIGRDVNKPLPGAVGMTKTKPGNAETKAFEDAKKLIKLLSESHDVNAHAEALVSGGNAEHPAQNKR